MRPSLIQGKGLFAREPIDEGTGLIELGGTVLDDIVLMRLRPHSSLGIAEGLNLVQEEDDPAQFGNHSCDPNLWMTDEVTVTARRPVAYDEELTTDYAMMTVLPWHMDCRYGAPTCRRTISGNDWMLPELQQRYDEHFSPFIVERILNRR